MVTWVLDDIYRQGERDKLIAGLKNGVGEFRGYRSKLDDSLLQDEFMAILKAEEELTVVAGRLTARASLRLSEDTADSGRISEEAMVSQLCAEASNETMFFGLWFKDLDDGRAAGYIMAAGPYRYVLERIRAFGEHTLGEREERVINLKDLTGNDSLTRLYDIVTGRFRFQFENKALTFDEVSQYKTSPSRKRRVRAYEVTLRKFAEKEDVLGEIYRSIVMDWRNEEVVLRRFKSSISAVNLGNDLPDESVKTMLKVVRESRGVFEDYFRLKARLCRLRRMDRYDIYAPYLKEEGKYTYGECVKATLESYGGFDPMLGDYARRIFDERHVHSKTGGNKQHGAFSYLVRKDATPYVMLNHTNKLNDLYNMVHEVGHGIHAMAARGQTEFTYRAELPLAETASLFGEMLLTERLLSQSDEEERIAILVRMLDGQYASITRQAYFTLFEEAAHESIAEGAAVEDLNRLYLKSLREQFGRSVIVPKLFEHEWKTIQHIYHSPFYCYSYAFGNLLTLSLYRMYRKEGEGFKPKYLNVLGKGGSDSPKNILSGMGVDVSDAGFWRGGFEVIKEDIDKLRRL